MGKIWYQGPRSYFRSTVRSEIFIGRLTIKSPQFVLPLSISRYGIASKQQGNSNYGTEGNTKTRGVTWRRGQLLVHSRPITSNKGPGIRTPPKVASFFLTFALPQLTVRRCLLSFQAQGHPNLQWQLGNQAIDR